MRHYLVVISCMAALFILVPKETSAQRVKDYILFGDSAYTMRDYYGASIYYGKALAMDSGNIHISYKYANALRNYNEYPKAANVYEQIYKEDKGDRYPDAIFWLATMQKNTGDYESSGKSWKKAAREYKGDRKSYEYLKCMQEISACQNAPLLLENPVPFEVKNLGAGVNSYDSEFAPFIGPDSMLYFSTLRAGKENEEGIVKDEDYHIKIFNAKGKDASWKVNGPIDSMINSNGFHAANGTYSRDGKFLFFSRCDDDYNCGIYFATKTPSGWTPSWEVRELKLEGATNTQPMIGQVGGKDVLFFVSDRKGGQGKLDIWYSEMTGPSDFAEPINLGTTINTPGDDISPFYHDDDTSLYFASDWHEGLGGFDIFRSIGDLNSFQQAKNVGFPINSYANDFYYNVVPDGASALLSSNRKGSITAKGETCCNDIYRIQLPNKTGAPVVVSEPEILVAKEIPEVVTDKKPSTVVPKPEVVVIPIPEPEVEPEPEVISERLAMIRAILPVTLYFHNDEPDPDSRLPRTNSDYMQVFDSYNSVRDDYYQIHEKEAKRKEKEEALDNLRQFFENHVEKGVSDLQLFMSLLLEELEDGAELEITIKGFCSPRAETDYNTNLSMRRIESLQNYLSRYDKGIVQKYLKRVAPNGAKLFVVEIPFGEFASNQEISDDLFDEKNSIYSVAASMERRIQITTINKAIKGDKYAELVFDQEMHNFGRVWHGKKLHHEYTFQNIGNQDLVIEDVIPGCDCSAIRYPVNPIRPGENGSIFVELEPQKPGIHAQSIEVISNGFQRKRILNLSAEVIKK